MTTQTPIKYNSINKKHETFDVTDTIDPQFITSIPLSSTAPVADVVTTGAVGVGTESARSDHAHPFTHELSSATNTLSYTHNGDAKTAPIVNSNTLTASGSGLISNINGVASTLTPATGTIAQNIGFDAGGALVKSAPTNVSLATVAPPADAITTGVVGVSTNAARQDHAHPFTHSLALTQAGGLVYTHNGDAKTVAIPTGTVAQNIGFDASGNPVRSAFQKRVSNIGAALPIAVVADAGTQGLLNSSGLIEVAETTEILPKIGSDGILRFYKRDISGKRGSSGGTTVAFGVFVEIPFTNTVYLNGGILASGNGFQVTAAGKYRIDAVIHWQQGQTWNNGSNGAFLGSTTTNYVFVNGVLTTMCGRVHVPAGLQDFVVSEGSCQLNLAANDIVTIRGYHNSAAAKVTFGAGIEQFFFNIEAV